MKKHLLYCAAIVFACNLFGQTAGLNTVVQLNAVANGDGTITLIWPTRTFTGTYRVYKNTTGVPLAFSSALDTLQSTETSWKDATFTAGSKAEYAVVRHDNAGSATAIGYLMAGNETKEVPSYGGIMLLIDSNYIKPLAAELATLKVDLQGSGWVVTTVYAGRNEKASTVKTRIKTAWDAASPGPSSLYIIGHVPVPYSGNFTGNSDRCAYPPDGHIEGAGDHTGAWPADVYYGDLEGVWTDNIVNCTTGAQSRHHNVPGDGKFDQCDPPSPVGMQIGRADFYNMPTFNPNDTALMKKYLDRMHNWRLDKIPYVERGLVDDNFTGYDIAGTGYAAISACVSLDSVFSNRDYFTYQNKESYLWSYGCGAGSYTNCSGIGANNNFNPGVFNNIFTALAGSFFGDWDAQNCFLKGPICSGSLISFWGGIPKWYTHYFGLGQPMGFSAMVTQNLSSPPSFNGSQNKVHIGLMGDPAVTLKSVPPAGALTATSSSGHVNLSWQKATGTFDGYCVYKIDTTTNTWIRVNTSIITDTFYADFSTWATGKYKYAVRSIRLETTGSGTYYNLGGGGVAWISHTNKLNKIPELDIAVSPNPSAGIFHISLSSDVTAGTFLTVTDMSGREIKNIHWTKSGNNNITLDMDGCSNGIYLLKIKAAGASGVSKIQVQH